MDIAKLKITNPKRQVGQAGLYNYYAGYSQEFSSNILSTANLPNTGVVFDPWNGSGTTTTASSALGISSIGRDINPVMVVAAKANLISRNDIGSLKPIGQNISKKAKQIGVDNHDTDPLAVWFMPSGVSSIRRLERSIQSLLVSTGQYRHMHIDSNVAQMSALAAFYYVALFRMVRKLLTPFLASNPTWIKKPTSLNQRLRPSINTVTEQFLTETLDMIKKLSSVSQGKYSHELSQISVGASTNIDLVDSCIDFVLTSPPYCTRIDYAVATLPELSILGFDADSFDKLRRSMIGTTTVQKDEPARHEKWGKTCCSFLDKMMNHESKASATYYYKNHLQYFDSIFNSLSQISRVLKKGGVGVFVVQDSYYKDVYNDLSQVYTEMAMKNNLELLRKESFQVQRSMAGLKYKTKYTITESVMCFLK